ncbi:MAG TPA: 4-hydroxy-tetrahydrodipicolinate reductase [Thermopetrobacter sp.]|nr:4-hydroxy-tetrahydrodipicolinate reductase [Thermopetrobacter sp.]
MRLAVAGAAGRMGRAITRVLLASEGVELAGGLEPKGAPTIGRDMGELAGVGPVGIAVSDDPLALLSRVDGVIDFTTPETTVYFAELAAQARIIDVIGTTGLSPEQERAVAAAARHARIVKAGNMSLGVNLLVALARKVAATLGPEFDIEIVEMHHRHKVDAPSGTALMLGRAAAAGRGVDLDEKAVYCREGHTGPRPDGAIGFATLRGGTVVGEHAVVFAGPDETVRLEHRAQSREIFARGAVRAALWAADRAPGLYSMADVLGLNDL